MMTCLLRRLRAFTDHHDTIFSFAFALHTHFVTDDAAAENIATLRRTHSFMPYRTVATILRFSNPIAMVKMMLDLFMAQPLGGKSLFQR